MAAIKNHLARNQHIKSYSAIRDYNEGKTTQVPAVFSVRLKSRYCGSIHAEGRKLVFEGGINVR